MPSALMKGTILCAAMAATVVSGCSDDDDDDDVMPVGETDAMTVDETDAMTVDETEAMTVDESAAISVDGLVSIDSARPVVEATGALSQALDNNDAITAVALIDHQANAAGIDEILRPTSVQLFGNPVLGTPLMQVNQLAGLDLPQKILAWENEDGLTQLAYNSADYLQQRHAINGSDTADTALQTISGALDGLSIAASGNLTDGETEDTTDVEAAQTVAVAAGEGIITVVSTQDFDTTYNALVASIQDPLILVAEVDHGANATNVGLTLNPTRLLIFGNPAAGTPLIQAEQTIGIDLPQKMLVFQDADDVVIAYNDPVFLATRHGITGQEERLAAISGALAGLANNAAGTTALP